MYNRKDPMNQSSNIQPIESSSISVAFVNKLMKCSGINWYKDNRSN